MGDAPLVPERLYGLRTWRLVRGEGESLAAPQRGTPWPPGGGWLRATCDAGHPAPAASCRCGLHAWHPRPAFARRVLAGRFELPGIVEAEGVVEVHEDGFRAERARPYAFVVLPTRNARLVERLAAAYGAEVLALRRADELLTVCGERGLGLSEPVVEELVGAEALAQRRRARARRRRADATRLVAAALAAATLGVAGIVVDHGPAAHGGTARSR